MASKYLWGIGFILILISFVFLGYQVTEQNLEAYSSGYRYSMLKLNLVLIPLFGLLAFAHLVRAFLAVSVIDKRLFNLVLKYLGGLFALVILLTIGSLLFNDPTAPGVYVDNVTH